MQTNEVKKSSKKEKRQATDPINPYRAKNIETGEEIQFRSYLYGIAISEINQKSLSDRYIDEPRHHRGFVYYTSGNRYWMPPKNFKFIKEETPSTNNIPCKSIHKTTGEVMYYSSVKEAARFILGDKYTDSRRKDFNDMIIGKNKNNTDYDWYQVKSFGSWIYPDGRIEEIKEEIIY
jgi:hypothetical protein